MTQTHSSSREGVRIYANQKSSSRTFVLISNGNPCCRCGCNNLVSSSLNISQLERFFCPYWPHPCRSYTCPAPATPPPTVHYIHGWGDKTARLEDRASNDPSRRFHNHLYDRL